MKEQGRILRFRPWLCALGILFSAQYASAATWIGNATSDVTDQDLILDASAGDIVLQAQDDCNGIGIFAETVDITVTITGGDAVVKGNGDGGQTILRLVPAAGRTITFDLTGSDSLTFEGSTDVDLSRLLILHEGEGIVTFNIRGGNSLTLTNVPGDNGPVEFYLILSDTTVSELNFFRNDLGNPTNEADQAYIIIGGQSLLSYASTDGLSNISSGAIRFDPTNAGIGRMIVQVNDTGAFTMAIEQAVFTADDIDDYCAVNRNIPSGGFAMTDILYSGDGTTEDGALMILNYNATYAEYVIDPFGNQGATSDPINYSGTYNGFSYGVVAGANHVLNFETNSYLDYVGLSNNTCPTPGSLPGIVDPSQPLSCPCTGGIDQFLKPRNYSAFVVDGWYNPNAIPSQITFDAQSGIYFRSGVDVNGVVENPTFPTHVFTISPSAMTPGAGEYVFDVEAPLFITGDNASTTDYESRLEILSYEVVPHAGPLFPVEGVGNPPLFLARDFIQDSNGAFYQYNKAAWLINDELILANVSLAHTDELHQVCSNNDVTSEPTYVGGEKWWLSFLRGTTFPFNYCIMPVCPLVLRPSIQFEDSLLQVQTSIAFTGVDLFVPTYVISGTAFANNSEFRFYSNGYLCDQGTGRSMILGTLIGSQACDGCTIISDDAHLNIFQTSDYTTGTPPIIQELDLTASQNNSFVDSCISTVITGQTSVEAIYLGHNSNISIGTNGSTTGFTVANSTTDILDIAGDFFAFGTRGGSLGIPSTSSVTGQGGIFVDLNGVLTIDPNYIASMDVMVTKSQNGIVNLPPSQVHFADQVGVTDWNANLSVNDVLVSTGQFYSDYTINWLTLVKSPNFMPYLISDINICSCPPVTMANITDIPVIQGEVDQLQIVNSRIGDPAHIHIAGGWVRELLWLSDCVAGEAPTAVVVLDDNGRLGLNNAHRNPDSLLTQTILGANGINIVANGNARIDLNDDVIVDNICAILQGPNWANGNVIEFLADTPYTLHVTSTGILDFSNFTIPGTIRFGGNIRVNFEPGARIILGTADVEFTDFAMVEVETAYELQLRISALDGFWGPVDNTVNPLVAVSYEDPNNQYSPLTGYGVSAETPTELQVTDPYRVRLMGIGTMRFTDNSQMLIPTNGILGVEALSEVLPNGLPCTIDETDVTLEIMEAAQFNIGSGNNILGGVLQIGDTTALGEEFSVNFTLTINGADAAFTVGAGGFFGIGAGVVRPNQGLTDDAPLPSVPAQPFNQSRVLADTLFDVAEITFNWLAGNFNHNRIFVSDAVQSNSMVIGAVDVFNINFVNTNSLEQLDAADFLSSGGGNLFLMVPGTGGDISNRGAIRLIDRTDDDIILAPFGSTTVPLTRLFDGILASTELIADFVDISGTPADIFGNIKVSDATNEQGRSTGLADAAPVDPQRFRQERTLGLFGYVDRGMIGRFTFSDVIDVNAGSPAERRSRAYDLGAARVAIDTTVAAPGPVLFSNNIQS